MCAISFRQFWIIYRVVKMAKLRFESVLWLMVTQFHFSTWPQSCPNLKWWLVFIFESLLRNNQVVGDVDDIFVPLQTGFMVDPDECKENIQTLLTQIPQVNRCSKIFWIFFVIFFIFLLFSCTHNRPQMLVSFQLCKQLLKLLLRRIELENCSCSTLRYLRQMRLENWQIEMIENLSVRLQKIRKKNFEKFF